MAYVVVVLLALGIILVMKKRLQGQQNRIADYGMPSDVHRAAWERVASRTISEAKTIADEIKKYPTLSSRMTQLAHEARLTLSWATLLEMFVWIKYGGGPPSGRVLVKDGLTYLGSSPSPIAAVLMEQILVLPELGKYKERALSDAMSVYEKWESAQSGNPRFTELRTDTATFLLSRPESETPYDKMAEAVATTFVASFIDQEKERLPLDASQLEEVSAISMLFMQALDRLWSDVLAQDV